MLSNLKDLVDETFDLVDKGNPFIEKLTETSKEMSLMLLDAGFTVPDIKKFTNVSSAEFHPWIDAEVALRKRVDAVIKKRKQEAKQPIKA